MMSSTTEADDCASTNDFMKSFVFKDINVLCGNKVGG